MYAAKCAIAESEFKSLAAKQDSDFLAAKKDSDLNLLAAQFESAKKEFTLVSAKFQTTCEEFRKRSS
jgi:hypothetical protein